MNNMLAHGAGIQGDHVNERLTAREADLGEEAADVE